MNEEKFINGFNDGYILAEHKSELLKTVTQNLQPANEYVEGILDGKEQLKLEKMQEQISEIEQLRNRSYDKKNSLERE